MKKLFAILLSLFLIAAIPVCACAAEEEAQPTAFSAAFDAVCSHAGEIFAAVACLLSATLTFSYRKGILPLLKNGIASVSAATKKWKEEADARDGANTELLDRFSEALDGALDGVGRTEDAMRSVEEKIKDLESDAAVAQTLRAVLLCEVDLLNEVFLSSSLPEYAKEQVSARVGAMKRLLDAPGESEK